LIKKDVKHDSLTDINAAKNITSTNLITQGLTDDSRIGNQTYSSGIKFRILLGQPCDRPNVTSKSFIVEYKDQAGTVTHPAHVQHNTSGNVMLDPAQNHDLKY